jgi:hypothetical protein
LGPFEKSKLTDEDRHPTICIRSVVHRHQKPSDKCGPAAVMYPNFKLEYPGYCVLEEHICNRYEFLTSLKMSVLIWVVMPCELIVRYTPTFQRHTASIFSPEVGGSMFLQNVGRYLWLYMALQPKRPTPSL